jgi:hypothetical protein
MLEMEDKLSLLTESEKRDLMLLLEEFAQIEGLRNYALSGSELRIYTELKTLTNSKAEKTDVIRHDGSVALTNDWDIGDEYKIIADQIRARDGEGLALYEDGGSGIFIGDGGDVNFDGKIKFDENTYIELVGSDLSFTDVVTGTRTLKNIGCPVYLYIKATGQAEGDLHLSDGTNWNVSKALIKTIRVITSSTDWDLYLLQNDNSFATDDAVIPKLQIMEAGNGNAVIQLDYPYHDEDASGEVHLYYLDNSGANTATIIILGHELV